jgi:hypothetical protein
MLIPLMCLALGLMNTLGVLLFYGKERSYAFY